MEEVRKKIRDIPNFPKEGIIFKDITTALGDRQSFKKIIDTLTERYKDKKIDKVVGIDARGFILAGALAYTLNAGFIPIRKKGKLPHKTKCISYDLEYGSNTIEIHEDAIAPGERVLIIDDLLATGGTMEAGASLVKQLGGEIVEIAFMIDLTFLEGKKKLKDHPVFSLIEF